MDDKHKEIEMLITIHQKLTASWKVLVETEGLITAAQDQKLATSNYQENIINNRSRPISRPCKQKTESIDHLVSGCHILAQIKYKENMIK